MEECPVDAQILRKCVDSIMKLDQKSKVNGAGIGFFDFWSSFMILMTLLCQQGTPPQKQEQKAKENKTPGTLVTLAL